VNFRILAADHTGITVSNLERSLEFWQNVLGFEFSHRAHQSGEMAEQITGVQGAELKLVVVKAPGGHKIELLEYLAPPDRKKDADPSTSLPASAHSFGVASRTSLRPCDVGHVHVALTVDNLESLLHKIAESGWKAAGKPQTLTAGQNAGKRVIYVRDPDGTTIEFMEIAS
jgi:glyoxylase I family protein